MSDSLWPHRLYSLLGSSVRGISQARILQWVTISFSRASSPPWDLIQVCRIAGRFCCFLFFFNSYLFLALLGLRCCTDFRLVAASRDYPSVWCSAFSLWWLLWFQSSNSRAGELNSCSSGLWSTGSVLWHKGLVAPRRVRSSRTRN